jgi:hypothetical protein
LFVLLMRYLFGHIRYWSCAGINVAKGIAALALKAQRSPLAAQQIENPLRKHDPCHLKRLMRRADKALQPTPTDAGAAELNR